MRGYMLGFHDSRPIERPHIRERIGLLKINPSADQLERRIAVSESVPALEDVPVARAEQPEDSSTFVKVLARLRYLKLYRAGWDGPGTRAAEAGSFELAEQFLGLVQSIGPGFHADATIFAPGTAVLLLRSDEMSATLEFLPDGTIAANVDRGEMEIDEDIPGFHGVSIPDELLGLLIEREVQLSAA